MFGKVVRPVGWTWVPKYMELLLIDSILNPIRSHVHGLGFSLADFVVGKTIGGGIVNLNRGGRLRMSHFLLVQVTATPELKRRGKCTVLC
jgi:hypothetical protein